MRASSGSVSACTPGKHRRHEAADRLGVDDRIARSGPAAAPPAGPRSRSAWARSPRPRRRSARASRLTTTPSDTQSMRVQMPPSYSGARASMATHVRLRRVADRVGAGVDHVLEQHALVEARAADQEVVGRPFAALVLAPGLAQPFAVRLEAAGGQHAGSAPRCARRRRRRRRSGRPSSSMRVDRRVVADLHAQLLGAAVVGIDQRLAAAHEEGVGARQVQRARQRAAGSARRACASRRGRSTRRGSPGARAARR